MAIQSLPEVQIVTSNSTKRGGNFSVDEDHLLISAWLNIGMNAVHVEARNRSGATDEDKLKDAKDLYKATLNPTTGKKIAFAYEHCWVVLKNQPKWSMPKEKSKGLSQTPSSIDQVDSNDDDIVVLERPIGRKAEKAKRKRTDDDKGFADYLAKKLQYIQASHEQDQEALRIKVEKIRVDAERIRLETIREERSIMTMDTSGMNEKERHYFENLKDQILARKVGVDPYVVSMGRSLFKQLLFDDLDEDEIMRRILKGSTSRRKHRRYIERDRLADHKRLYLDYFSDTPVYPPNLFRRRFRMSQSLFLRIQSKVEIYEPYFIQKRDNAQKWGLSSLQKITVALRMLAYGVTADFMDKYVRIGESTAMESLKKFVKAVVDIFSKEYLRSPNNEDITRLLANGERRGFLGMLGSIDCMHWKWKNCLVAWKCQYSGHLREPTSVLEAVASFDLWIWHAFFGLPRSNNDINILERSPVFSELEQGRAPAVNYSINGHEYTMGYYLVDGIYPKWL
ncbi:hypothetical protein SO802_020778 [Lithocarpus litseifolius]|uniref:No apical meristem-associated C-terminal domain-containing protein n=1 Tax=Lithocarpus litseifolius TaxID=425828 RepID=A0AAW2CFE1_9ROSI